MKNVGMLKIRKRLDAEESSVVNYDVPLNL